MHKAKIKWREREGRERDTAATYFLTHSSIQVYSAAFFRGINTHIGIYVEERFATYA